MSAPTLKTDTIEACTLSGNPSVNIVTDDEDRVTVTFAAYSQAIHSTSHTILLLLCR